MAAPPVPPSPPQSTFTSSAFSGANLCDAAIPDAQLDAAQAAGIHVVRFTPDSWKSAQRDFLIGDADQYIALVDDDLKFLQKKLDTAHRLGLRVIITTRTLPGARWASANPETPDGRLWKESTYQLQAIRFWKDLAAAIGSHPAIIAFDPLYRPFPLFAAHKLSDPTTEEFARVVATTRGSLVDADVLYDRIIRGIRQSAPRMPVIVHSIGGGSPYAMRYLRPQADPAVMYAFRAFEPTPYTDSRLNQTRFHYPDRMPGSSDTLAVWNRDKLAAAYQAVVEFQRKYAISAHRILVSEYGASRKAGGVVGYFTNLHGIFQTHGWNRLLYCFQSVSKPEYDYELGTNPASSTRSNNSLWKTIRKDFSARLK